MFLETGSHADKLRTGRILETTDRMDRKFICDALKDREKTFSGLTAAYQRTLENI